MKTTTASLALAALFLSTTAMADSAALYLAPMRVILTDGRPTEVININNHSDKPRTYTISLIDEEMDGTGALHQPKGEFALSAKRMVKFMPHQITLREGQRQAVRVMAVVPAGTPVGSYHTHLVFDEQLPKNALVSATQPARGITIDMAMSYSMAVPIMVEHGAVSSKLTLQQARLEKVNGAPAVKITLNRQGNKEAEGMLSVTPQGTSQTVTAPSRARVYPEVTTYTATLPLRVTATTPLEAHLTLPDKTVQTVPVSQ